MTGVHGRHTPTHAAMESRTGGTWVEHAHPVRWAVVNLGLELPPPARSTVFLSPALYKAKRLTHAHTTHNNDNDSNRTHPHGTPTAPGKMTRELRVFQRHWGERYRPRAQGRETRVCLGDVVGRWGKTNCQLQPKQKRGMGVSGNPDAEYWCWRAGRAARSNTRRFVHRHICREKIGTSNSCFSLRT